MKKTLFTNLLLAALLPVLSVSCMEMADHQVPGSENPLEMSPAMAASTKAPIDGTTFPTARTMKVSAYYNDPDGASASADYFSNTTFSLRDGNWKGGTAGSPNPKYWPMKGTLDIFAYSADGLTPSTLAYTPTYHLADVGRGATITVPDNSSVQSDILLGRIAAQVRIPGGNPMVFRHAEACLVFVASSTVAYDATANTGITITGITVTDGYWSGTLAMDGTAAAGSQCTWSSLGSQKDLALPVASGTYPYNVPTTAMDVTTAGHHMGIGSTGIVIPEQTQTGFTVFYTIHNGKDDAGTAVDNAMSYHYDLSTSGTWDEGRKYVYELAFDVNEIEVLPSIVDWNAESVTAEIPYVDPANGYDYVEIGGMKWATMNVGAASVTDPGLFFQWGDTQGYTAAQVGSGAGQKYFGWADYKWGNGQSSSVNVQMTKYNSTDGKETLDIEDDAARAYMGGKWRVPAPSEFTALRDAVNVTLTDNYMGTGIAGMVCTDKTDASKVLFFPGNGHATGGTVDPNGNVIPSTIVGVYWTNSIVNVPFTIEKSALNLYFYHDTADHVYWTYSNALSDRSDGKHLRGILDEN